MAKTTIYFSERKVSDQEIWQYILENSTGDTSDFIKYLIRIGMNIMNGRTKTPVYGQTNHARLKRQSMAVREPTRNRSNTVSEQTKSSPDTVSEPIEGRSGTVSGQTENRSSTVQDPIVSHSNTVLEPIEITENRGKGDFELEITEENDSHESDPFFQTETDPDIIRLFNK